MASWMNVTNIYNKWKKRKKVKVKSLSRVQLFVTPWTVAHQAPLSLGFSRQEYWSGVHFLLQGIFPTQGSNPGLLHCRQTLYRLSQQGSLKEGGFKEYVLYDSIYWRFKFRPRSQDSSHLWGGGSDTAAEMAKGGEVSRTLPSLLFLHSWGCCHRVLNSNVLSCTFECAFCLCPSDVY